jgi:hypothetical protein
MLSQPQGHSAAERIVPIEKNKKTKNNDIGNLTQDLPACSIALQPTTPPCAPPVYPDVGKFLRVPTYRALQSRKTYISTNIFIERLIVPNQFKQFLALRELNLSSE